MNPAAGLCKLLDQSQSVNVVATDFHIEVDKIGELTLLGDATLPEDPVSLAKSLISGTILFADVLALFGRDGRFT